MALSEPKMEKMDGLTVEDFSIVPTCKEVMVKTIVARAATVDLQAPGSSKIFTTIILVEENNPTYVGYSMVIINGYY